MKVRTPAEWLASEAVVYCSQKLSFTELHKTVVRERLRRDYGKVFYTYSRDFLSGAFVLQDPEEQAREELAASKAKWLTQDGFRTIKASKPTELIQAAAN